MNLGHALLLSAGLISAVMLLALGEHSRNVERQQALGSGIPACVVFQTECPEQTPEKASGES